MKKAYQIDERKAIDRFRSSAAGVNQAAINYHFRSKEGLIRAVYARRLGPVNQRRLEMLDACEAKHSSGRLPLEEVVEAFVAPIVRLGPEVASAR